jgi:hypothetical protein
MHRMSYTCFTAYHLCQRSEHLCLPEMSLASLELVPGCLHGHSALFRASSRRSGVKGC